MILVSIQVELLRLLPTAAFLGLGVGFCRGFHSFLIVGFGFRRGLLSFLGVRPGFGCGFLFFCPGAALGQPAHVLIHALKMLHRFSPEMREFWRRKIW